MLANFWIVQQIVEQVNQCQLQVLEGQSQQKCKPMRKSLKSLNHKIVWIYVVRQLLAQVRIANAIQNIYHCRFCFFSISFVSQRSQTLNKQNLDFVSWWSALLQVVIEYNIVLD